MTSPSPSNNLGSPPARLKRLRHWPTRRRPKKLRLARSCFLTRACRSTAPSPAARVTIPLAPSATGFRSPSESKAASDNAIRRQSSTRSTTKRSSGMVGRRRWKSIALREGTGEVSKLVVDKQTADVVLAKQGIHCTRRQRSTSMREIDEVRAAIRSHDHIGISRVIADRTIAAPRMVVRFDLCVLLVRIKQRQTKRGSDVDGYKPRR